jgi:iron complex outermembrane recepter protein
MRPNTIRRYSFLSVLILTSFALRPLAHAQATAPENAEPAATQTDTDDKTVKLETFTVHGYQESLNAALNVKRASGDNVDVITAEDVGKFPDTNVAESLSHLPGVTIDRLFGDGERVSILGTDPNLNRTLLNGEPVATADWYILDTPSRQFNYVLLAPEVIGQAEVYRTWEPRLLEGSIGGTIIVNTLDPLKGKELSTAATANETYNGLSKKHEPSFSATVSWRNPGKTFGLLIGAEDQKEYIRRDGVEALGILGNYTNSAGIVVQNTYGNGKDAQGNSNGLVDTNLPQAGTATQPAKGSANFATDEVINTALFEQLRHRQGVNSTLEFKPSEQLELSLSGLYVDENMDNTNTSLYPMYMANGSVFTNPTFAHGILTSSTVTGSALEFDLFARKAEIKTQDYDAKAVYSDDNFKLTGNLGFTRATGGTQMQAYRGANTFDTYSITEGPSSASYNVTPATSLANWAATGDVMLDSTGNAGWGGLVEEPEVDQEKWAQLDFELPLQSSFLKKLVAGLRTSVHDTSESSYHQVAFNGPGERNYLALFTPVLSNYLSGLSGITTTMATHPVGTNFGAIFNQTANTPASAADVASGYWPGLVVGETLAQYAVNHKTAAINDWLAIPTDSATVGPTFQAEEIINAAYLEAEFSHGPVSGNAGVRLVETKTTGTSVNVAGLNGQPLTAASLGQFGAPGYQPLANAATWTPAEYAAEEVPIIGRVDHTYYNLLPAMNLAYDVARDQVARFAAAEVISRPNLLQEFGYTTLYPLNTPGDIGGNGVGGTAGLNPYKSVNLDADYEWYFTKNSYVSVDLFYKDIENYIVNETRPEIHANTTTWEDQWFYVTRPENGGKAKSKGIAFSYQQALAGGFGIQANYTRLRADGASGPLPYASKNQVNIGPYFENRYGLIRLTYSWRDDYATGSFNGSSTVYTRPYTDLDANAQINLTKNVSLLLAVRNITNETYAQYYTLPNGGGELFANAYKVGTSYSAGVHCSF